MHTTMGPKQVKTMEIQAGEQGSRPEELRRHLQLWKCFGRLYYIVIVLVRNISCQPLSLSFDFVFMSEIFKSLSFSLDHLCHLAILYLDQHAHTLHLLESLRAITLDNLCLDNLDILKEDLEYQSLRKMRYLHLHLYMNPEIKQSAIKVLDEYGFVIRLDLVGLASSSVTDMSKMDKNKAKWTKPSTGMERVQEIEAEGPTFTHFIRPDVAHDPRATIDGLEAVWDEGLGFDASRTLLLLDPSA
ncbi:hypothetical protein Tco_0546091 [Tanacetum coccineum]